jgi:hypothetical protein
MFIGDGAKLVRDAFALAKEKSPGKSIISINYMWIFFLFFYFFIFFFSFI